MASRSHVCTLCASASDFRGWQYSDCHCQCQQSRQRRSVRSRLRCAQVPANAGSTAVGFVIVAHQASLVLVRSDHACTRGSLTVSSTARYCVALHYARQIRSVYTFEKTPKYIEMSTAQIMRLRDIFPSMRFNMMRMAKSQTSWIQNTRPTRTELSF